jgi:hypothetical protein
MKIFMSRVLFASLDCLMVIASTAKAQKQEVTISEPAPVKIEELFRKADRITGLPHNSVSARLTLLVALNEIPCTSLSDVLARFAGSGAVAAAK